WPSSSDDFFQDCRQSVTLFWQRSIASDESAHFHEVSSHMNAINIREQVFIHGHIWATMVAYGVTSQDLIVVLSQVWGRGFNQNIKILRQVVGHLAKDVVVCSHSALPKRCWLCPSFNIGRGVGNRPKITSVWSHVCQEGTRIKPTR